MRSNATAPATAAYVTVLTYSWSRGVTEARYDDVTLREGYIATYDRTPRRPP